MPYDVIKLAHHAGALALFGFIALGVVAPLFVKRSELRANLYPVEGMGGMASALFQVVAGANLAGRSDIPWNTPWVGGAVALLLLAMIPWMASLARRAKGNTADAVAPRLNAAALVAVAGCYAIMLAKPAFG